jgi:hypothetical protein
MVESPCVKICELNGADICVGCGRTRVEIAAWSSAPESRKAQIVELAARRKRLLDPRQLNKPARRD